MFDFNKIELNFIIPDNVEQAPVKLTNKALAQNLKLTLKVSISVEGDILSHKSEDTKVALQKLGLVKYND